MSKEKQNPCEAAWKEWHDALDANGATLPLTAERDFRGGFSAGFRAGEEGKKELLEALKAYELALIDGPENLTYLRYEELSAKARAAIAKHTAK